jgi:hypothetical protein
MRERVGIIGQAAAKAGRAVPTISARLTVDFSGTRQGPSILTGSAEEMAAGVQAYVEAGTQHLALDFGETDPDMAAKAIERFEREVAPAL